MSYPDEFTCRTCMVNRTNVENDVNNKKADMISIFNAPNNAKENLTFLEIIKSAIPQLRIEEDDLLPKWVCLECSVKIQDLFKFQQKCLDVEQKFYNMLRNYHAIHHFENLDKGVYVDQKEISSSIQEVKVTFDDNGYFCEDNISNKSTDSVWSNISDCPWKQSKNERKSKVKRKTIAADNKKVKNDSTKLKKSLRKTSNNVPVNEKYPCGKCQRKLKSKLSLIKHQEMHNKKDEEEHELKCNVCDIRFSDSGLFKIHQRTHNAERSFLCSECGKGFTSAGGLKQHSLRHLDKRMYHCSECPKSFHTQTDLLCHNDTHKAKPKIHVCDVCGKGFYKPFFVKTTQKISQQ